jgi:hypothetical protein
LQQIKLLLVTNNQVLGANFMGITPQSAIVPRKKVITGGNVAEAVEAADRPFATVTDIAEHLDVSAQGVRNNYEELQQYEGLEWGKVGQATVFWLPEQETPTQVTSTPATPPRQSPERTDEEGKGVLDRLFSVSPFGETAEVWALFGLVMLLGLTIGVAAGIALTHPSLGVASTAVFLLLLAGTVFSLGSAAYFSFTGSNDPDTNGETA